MVCDHPEFSDHEMVQFCTDPATGLRAIIAVHNTALGPAAGGCRMWPYPSAEAALTDALRLSRAMTYKNAVAGLDLGGGKSVIIGDPNVDKSPELLAAFGRLVERLGGYYFTAEDVGIGEDDIFEIAAATSYAIGTPTSMEGVGDPSPHTALGVFKCAQIALQNAYGRQDFNGFRVAVQGLGHVGWQLARHFHDAGAHLVVADIDPIKVGKAVTQWGAMPLDADRIHAADVDIFSPCALGGGLNERTLPELKAKIVVGAANNQLDTDERANDLLNAGIIYVPDFVANGGGIIHVASEIAIGGSPEWVADSIDALGDTARQILNEVAATRRSPVDIANKIAESRIASANSRSVA